MVCLLLQVKLIVSPVSVCVDVCKHDFCNFEKGKAEIVRSK